MQSTYHNGLRTCTVVLPESHRSVSLPRRRACFPLWQPKLTDPLCKYAERMQQVALCVSCQTAFSLDKHCTTTTPHTRTHLIRAPLHTTAYRPVCIQSSSYRHLFCSRCCVASAAWAPRAAVRNPLYSPMHAQFLLHHY